MYPCHTALRSDVRFSAALSPTNMVREVELSKVRFFFKLADYLNENERLSSQ